jgi:hypothetical protein
MTKIFYVILPVFFMTTSIYGQKCKNFKDELDPFTSKKTIISSGFSLSTPDINNKPGIGGQFILENDQIYLKLNFGMGLSKSYLSNAVEFSNDLISIKASDYIMLKFEGSDDIMKLTPAEESSDFERSVLGEITYIYKGTKFNITKAELKQFIFNKIEVIRVSKNNENNYLDYAINSTAKKENVIFSSKCFLTAMEK